MPFAPFNKMEIYLRLHFPGSAFILYKTGSFTMKTIQFSRFFPFFAAEQSGNELIFNEKKGKYEYYLKEKKV